MSTARRPERGAATSRPRRIVLPLLLLPLVFLPAGCVTAAMWDRLDHSRGERIAAVALTPVTVALDAALIAGEVCADSGCHGCGCRCR